MTKIKLTGKAESFQFFKLQFKISAILLYIFASRSEISFIFKNASYFPIKRHFRKKRKNLRDRITVSVKHKITKRYLNFTYLFHWGFLRGMTFVWGNTLFFSMFTTLTFFFFFLTHFQVLFSPGETPPKNQGHTTTLSAITTTISALNSRKNLARGFFSFRLIFLFFSG